MDRANFLTLLWRWILPDDSDGTNSAWRWCARQDNLVRRFGPGAWFTVFTGEFDRRFVSNMRFLFRYPQHLCAKLRHTWKVFALESTYLSDAVDRPFDEESLFNRRLYLLRLVFLRSGDVTRRWQGLLRVIQKKLAVTIVEHFLLPSWFLRLLLVAKCRLFGGFGAVVHRLLSLV